MFKWKLIVFYLVISIGVSGQTSITGCYLSGGMTNGKTQGCGSGTTACNMAATSYSYFGAFCGSNVTSGTASWVTVTSSFILPAGCTATVQAEMKPRPAIHGSGCSNSGADGSDFVAISTNGGAVVSESSTICCSTTSCTAYPTLPATITSTSASGFNTGCANATMKSTMIVTGGTVTISGKSDRADEVTTYTINLDGTCGANCSDVLPIQLLDFYGEAVENNIELHWRVANEDNVHHYLIEKSIDGQTFYTMAEIPSIADKAGAMNLSYNAIDYLPNRAINYYRLVNYDRDGSFQKSKVLAVVFTSKESNEIKVSYQNGEVWVQLSGIAINRNISVSDLSGRLITHIVNNGDNVFRIDQGLLPAGLFVLSVEGVHLPAEKLIIH